MFIVILVAFHWAVVSNFQIKENFSSFKEEKVRCNKIFQAMSALFPAMRFSWEIKSVDAVFCNGLSRLILHFLTRL